MVTSIWENLLFAGTILKAALGLGFVIFIHELGHFLLAKWNGVKVERFSIGFGPTLASYRRGVGLRVGSGSRPPGPGDPPDRGETEYVLAALPLGGYVKMLGESAEQATEEAARSPDSRAYHNKSVWARMQIITAGVILNVVLGIFCFAFVHGQGTLAHPANIGGVLPGGPAYKAGLRPGDEIVALDGRRDVSYKDLQDKVNFSSAGQQVRLTVKRPGVVAEQVLEIEPMREDDFPVPTIGIVSASSLELAPKVPFQAPPGQDAGQSRLGLEGEDKVLAVGPQGGPREPVSDYFDFIRKSERLRDRPMVVEVERKGSVPRAGQKASSLLAEVTLAPHHFVDFGFQLTPGPVAAIRNDSPAQRAGLRPGDRIVAVDGRKDFDPMRLPDEARGSAGRPWTLTVERPEDGKPARAFDVTLTPDDASIWGDPIHRGGPLDVPGLGLALAIEPKIRSVLEGSPAARAGLKPGDSLRSIIITPLRGEGEKADPKPLTIQLDEKRSNWPLAFAEVQLAPWKSIQLVVNSSTKPITVNPEADPSRFHPLRGLVFQGLVRRLPPTGLVESFGRGFDETVENIRKVLLIFRSIPQGRIGRDAFSGILGIGKIAYSSANEGWTPFIYFLGIMNVNLAVLNFLPIPPLDGGQFLFLAAEKVRGKPLPEAALNVLTLAGVVFVVGLILFINGNDVFRLIKSYL